jgi:hypothetical protein
VTSSSFERELENLLHVAGLLDRPRIRADAAVVHGDFNTACNRTADVSPCGTAGVEILCTKFAFG